MHKAILIMILAGVTSSAAAAEWMLGWRVCAKDTDCVILANPCAKDSEKTVNKKFEEDANRYLAGVNATKMCAASCIRGTDGKCKRPIAKCVESNCTLSK
jgi:hypothetical protein